MISFQKLSVFILVLILSLLSSPEQIYGYFGDPELDPHEDRCSRKSRDVSACIHKYLEKDFIGLSPIVYPKVGTPDSVCINSDEFERKNQILMDGPTLQNSCNDLHHVLDCMFEQLKRCNSMDTFLQFRHLHFSLTKVTHWLCGEKLASGQEQSDDQGQQHSSVRTRFLGLLESLKCIECVRTNHPACTSKSRVPSPEDDISLLHKVLRQEIGMERCHSINFKMACMQKDDILARTCGERASEVHKNLTDLFVSTWCDSAPFTLSKSTKASSSLLYLSLVLLIGNLCKNR